MAKVASVVPGLANAFFTLLYLPAPPLDAADLKSGGSTVSARAGKGWQGVMVSFVNSKAAPAVDIYRNGMGSDYWLGPRRHD